jgi:predicted O-linked N-acetylglucosamine transferase (SPINDLY family)
LRVGFVSADFRHHAVANYIEPILVHLVRDTQLSLHAYYNYFTEDNVTERLKGRFASWTNTASLSDEALAQKVRDDGIDILIDLSSHTADNRLLTFARKPAPVQVSWIGYPGSTGLKSMDYFLSDKHALPKGQFEDQFTEKIVRMPATAAFLPFKGSPPVNDLPAAKNGYLTFGSFNRPNKISRSVIALWSDLLRAIPNARMVLGSMPEVGQNNVLLQWFAQEGIGAARLSLYPIRPLGEYLALHHEVDICLDTFPYCGGTTSWHAIWMGVPTLTLTGDTVANRTGALILGVVGLDAFVAMDKEDFVSKGVAWAKDIQGLKQLRTGMRKRFLSSPAGQPEVVSNSFAKAMRVMWQRWCAKLPAESFEVSTINTSNRQTEGSQ